ncbi:MAG: PA2169 family four-helix-bundle protein [Ignavibacteriaceae bacterium]
MAINKEKIFSTLNELIETLQNAENGFKTAADNVKENDLKSLLVQYAVQRTEYINELQGLITELGGSPAKSGDVIHKGWMELKTAAATGNAQAILKVCETGENVAVQEFSKALKEDLPSDIKCVVSGQFGGIKVVYDNVKRLRDFKCQ